MPPTVITVRHAQGHHNVNNQWRIYDATLTDLGHQECATLAKNFPHHKKVDLLVASPLRRTIQTAVLSFGPVLARPEVPFLLHPKAQEVSERNCNIGFERDELKNVVKGLFEGQDLGFDLEGRVDYDGVVDGWNSKTGYWGPEKEAVEQRAADMRAWLYQRPEKLIVLVTHGAFLHYFTEDWNGVDMSMGSAFKNCEMREFNFTAESTQGDAHIRESPTSRRQRSLEPEQDPTVVNEVRRVEAVRSVI